MHHNTRQENEQIRQEYFATLQNLSDDEYYTEIDRAEFQYHTPVSTYDWLICCQEVPRPPQADNPLRNSNNYLEKAEEKPDVKNFIATDHLATKRNHWRAVYNGKLRKINACVKGTLKSINILLLYEHYVCVTPCQVHIKGF